MACKSDRPTKNGQVSELQGQGPGPGLGSCREWSAIKHKLLHKRHLDGIGGRAARERESVGRVRGDASCVQSLLRAEGRSSGGEH